MNDQYDFTGKTVLITGGNSGIGKASALMFATFGANVIIAARRENESMQVVKQITDLGGRAIFIQTDVSNSDSIKQMMVSAIKQFNTIDFAINNAGISGPTKISLIDYSESDYDEVMAINVKGLFIAMQEQLKHMQENIFGVIINMSSIAGLISGRAGSLYTASKHAVIGLTRSAAKENAEFGIRVNAICPTLIGTPMFGNPTSDRLQSIKESIPVGRLGQPEEIASACCWLCTDLAAFTTGIALPIDGGITA